MPKKLPGRPRKVRRNKRSTQLNIRLTGAEHHWISAKAKDKGETMADYARKLILKPGTKRGFGG